MADHDLTTFASDELLAEYRIRAEACSRTSYPLKGYERAFAALDRVAIEVERRGEDTIRGLLPLLEHPSEWVKYFAARDAYVVAPERCYEILFTIVEKVTMPSSWAIQTLLYFDPTFPDKFRALNRAQRSGFSVNASVETDAKFSPAKWVWPRS